MKNIVLGWKVNSDFDPLPFSSESLETISKDAYAKYLVEIEPQNLGVHSLVLAQSGSGKSFFLGRLLEEIILHSNIKCFVIDPNADFRNFHIMDPQKIENEYFSKSNSWQISNETDKNDISEKLNLLGLWEKKYQGKISIIRGDIEKSIKPYEKIRLFWPQISYNSFSSELNPYDQLELRLLHRIIQFYGDLVWLSKVVNENNKLISIEDFILRIKRSAYCSENKVLSPIINPSNSYDEIQIILNKVFSEINFENIMRLTNELFKSTIKNEDVAQKNQINKLPYSIKIKVLNNDTENLCNYISNKKQSFHLVPQKIVDYYESLHNEYSSLQLFTEDPLIRTQINNQVTILDLPSFPNDQSKYIALGQLLDEIWDQARFEWMKTMTYPEKSDNRKPIIIFIDEAHHIAPLNIENENERIIRDKIRTIAAEGRKYGIFLFLITQRPDKLDLKIISECQNIGLMKINSTSLLTSIIEDFNLDEYSKIIQSCKNFNPGRIILFGKWAQEQGTILYTATRRTREGGKKIPDKNFLIK